MKLSLLSACLVSSAIASPIFRRESNDSDDKVIYVQVEPESYLSTWADTSYPEIKNCNATQVKQLNKYYQDFIEVSSAARANLLENGANDIAFQHWFGKEANPLTVLGVIDNLVQGNKGGVTYRCDDIDGNCAKHSSDWPGYHREDAPQETVFCDLFFNSKHPIERICSEGDILEVKPKRYAGIDIFHRFLHLDSINKGFVGEYVEELEEIVDFAENNATFAVLNTDSLLYYIAETYSATLKEGGCLGKYPTSNSSNSTQN